MPKTYWILKKIVLGIFEKFEFEFSGKIYKSLPLDPNWNQFSSDSVVS